MMCFAEIARGYSTSGTAFYTIFLGDCFPSPLDGISLSMFTFQGCLLGPASHDNREDTEKGMRTREGEGGLLDKHQK